MDRVRELSSSDEQVRKRALGCAEVLRLTADSQRRVVRNGHELLELVSESLERFQRAHRPISSPRTGVRNFTAPAWPRLSICSRSKPATSRSTSREENPGDTQNG